MSKSKSSFLLYAVDHYYDPKIWKEVLKREHSSEEIRRLAGDVAREWLKLRDIYRDKE